MESSKRKKSKVKSNLSQKQKAKIRNRARATPWSNPSEFDYVGRCLSNATYLFEDHNNIMPLNELSFNELVYGIKQCELWRKRAENGRLPHSVEITCSIAELLLQDVEHQVSLNQQEDVKKRNYYNMTNLSLRLSYASAIIRGVNGIADSMQKNRATNGSSVAHLCSTIGIPSWVVDLRHDAAHNDLPSLVALRLAAKVLLRFLIDKYWIVLEEMRSKWRSDGIALLMEYKKSSKTLDKLQSLILKGEIGNDDDQEGGNDKEDEAEEDDVPYYGAYSIFLLEEKKDDKKKNETKPKAKDVKTKAEQEMKGRTPRQCLNEFVKTMPMDLGMELLLSYLVTGGIGDAPMGRGVMIPGSALTFPETIDAARKIRERYSVILIYMSSKWPGFIHAILVHLVDFVLDLNQNGNGIEDPGKKRKLFFLIHWIRYLLSQEFFCFLGWYDASFKGSKNIRQRPKEKWSKDLIEFMELPAPVDVLCDANIPFRGLYNRCIAEKNEELALIFKNIIRDDGDEIHLKKASKKRRMDESATADPNDTKDKNELVMSLDEMEALVLDCESNQISLMNRSVNHNELESKLPAWTPCKVWEPCAIGSIPGHP